MNQTNEPVAELNSIWSSDTGWQYLVDLLPAFATDKYLQSIDGKKIDLFTAPPQPPAQEYAKLKEDAHRYRWLKDNVESVPAKEHANKDPMFIDTNRKWQIKPYLVETTCVNSFVSFDEAIDQARNQNDR